MTEFTDPDGRRYVVVGSADITHKFESSLFTRRMIDPLILIQVMKGDGLVVDVDRFRLCWNVKMKFGFVAQGPLIFGQLQERVFSP